jgi:hypothetical protein
MATLLSRLLTLEGNRLGLFIGIHYQKLSVPQAAPSAIATVKPAAAASATTPRTQQDSRTAMRKMVLQRAALIARNKDVVSRLHPSLKSYTTILRYFTTL